MKTKKTSRFVWRVVWGAVALVVAPLVALVAVLAAIPVVLRLGGSKGRDAVRAFNKRVLNPAMMKLAGRRHWYAAVIRHRGHRSGKEYATPVVAVRVAGDAFIIPLPYGEGVDWLRNVLADGRATIEIKGETYDVFDPEVFGVEKAFPLLDERHRKTWRRFGIERYLRLKEVYRDPGAPRWKELRRFRDAHPPKHTTVGGVRWDYIASGDGDEALLILPGGAMVGEAGFTRIPAYEENYRVIAPSYASVSTAAELLDGLAGVLDAEGVREAHVIGQSYGGLVAQCFVRRHPERARSLILTNTLVPPRRILRLSKVLLRLLPLVPIGWLRKIRERGLARAFHGVPSVPLEDRAFWSEYQHGLISRLSKAELLDLYRLGIDLVQSHRFAPGDLASWPGRIFILESDEDILTPERRAELRRCYPRADVYTIHGAGHTPWMSHKEEYLAAIKEFLAGHVPAAPSRASLEQRSHAVRHPSEESGAATFPFQRPGRLVRAFFKGGTRAYRGPAARLMGAYSMLLLTTTGRKTGLPRRTALTFQDLDGRYLVLAGMGTRSDWYRNLLAHPHVEVRVGTRRFAATAEPVLDPERRRTLAPGIAEQWDRFGPPRPLRWLLRRWLRFDYDAELAYALAHAEDLPMVELAPS